LACEKLIKFRQTDLPRFSIAGAVQNHGTATLYASWRGVRGVRAVDLPYQHQPAVPRGHQRGKHRRRHRPALAGLHVSRKAQSLQSQQCFAQAKRFRFTLWGIAGKLMFELRAVEVNVVKLPNRRRLKADE
jgi:hypothetical protein